MSNEDIQYQSFMYKKNPLKLPLCLLTMLPKDTLEKPAHGWPLQTPLALLFLRTAVFDSTLNLLLYLIVTAKMQCSPQVLDFIASLLLCPYEIRDYWNSIWVLLSRWFDLRELSAEIVLLCTLYEARSPSSKFSW